MFGVIFIVLFVIFYFEFVCSYFHLLYCYDACCITVLVVCFSTVRFSFSLSVKKWRAY